MWCGEVARILFGSSHLGSRREGSPETLRGALTGWFHQPPSSEARLATFVGDGQPSVRQEHRCPPPPPLRRPDVWLVVPQPLAPHPALFPDSFRAGCAGSCTRCSRQGEACISALLLMRFRARRVAAAIGSKQMPMAMPCPPSTAARVPSRRMCRRVPRLGEPPPRAQVHCLEKLTFVPERLSTNAESFRNAPPSASSSRLRLGDAPPHSNTTRTTTASSVWPSSPSLSPSASCAPTTRTSLAPCPLASRTTPSFDLHLRARPSLRFPSFDLAQQYLHAAQR